MIGSVRDCGSSTRPTLANRPAGTRCSYPGTSISAAATERTLGASDSGTWPTTWICEVSTTRNRDVPAVTLAPVVAWRSATTPLTGARMMKSPSAPVAPPVRAALYWARLASAALTRDLACSSTDRASSNRLSGAAPAVVRRSARSRSRVANASTDCASARARCNCGRSPGTAGGGSKRPSSCPRDTLAPSGTSRTRVRRPSIGATASAAPPALASSCAGTRRDPRTTWSFTTAVPKSRLHCCSLRKLMPSAPWTAARAAARAASAFAATSTSPTRCWSSRPADRSTITNSRRPT